MHNFFYTFRPCRLSQWAVVLLLISSAMAPPLAAQEPMLSRGFHAWSTFKPGAWKKVRLATQTLNESGEVVSTSVNDRTILLEAVSPQHYSLQIESTVEVAGKKFDVEPQFLERGTFGEIDGRATITKKPEQEIVTIDQQEIACDVYRVEVIGEDKKQVTTTYYAPKIEPHLLRRSSVTTDPSGETVLYRIEEEVTGLDMPHQVIADIMPASHLKIVRTHPRGKTITFEVRTDQVPGGLVSHSSKELDENGRVIRRSVLELVDYGIEADYRVIRPLRLKRRKRRR